MKQVLHTGVLAALTATAVVGCGGGGGGDWAGSVTDSAGVSIVSNPADGMWSESAGWTVRQALQIGVTEGDPDYQFGQVAGIGVTADGRMYVLDQQSSEIRVFDREGALVDRFGRPGDGPGELGAGAGPLLMSGGETLYVPDMSNARVQKFAPDGSELGSFRIDFATGVPVAWDIAPTGRLVAHRRHFAGPGQEVTDTMDVLVTFDEDGAVADTLLTFVAGKTFSMSGDRPEFHFFSPEPVWSVGGNDALFFGVNDRYRFSVFGWDGGLRRVFAKNVEGEAVTDADREVFVEALESAWTTAGVPPQMLSMLKEGVHFAEQFPAYLQIRPGPAGSIWVQHLRPPRFLTETERENLNPQLGFGLGGAEWDVFDPDGRFLGVVTMPERFQPLRFHETDVYGVWRDDLDVQYVMRLEVQGITGGDTGGVAVGG